MDVFEEMRCKLRVRDWNAVLQAIDKENTRPSCEGWIRDEFLRDPPIPHQAIAMVPDLAPWTWTESEPDSDEQPIVINDEPESVFKKPGQLMMPVPVPAPVHAPMSKMPKLPALPRSEPNLEYMEWVMQTSMKNDVYECLCKWCTSHRQLKGHRCHLCSFVYADDVKLFLAHVKQVHGSAWPRKCSWYSCNVLAKNEEEMLEHLQQMHMLVEPFKCRGCGVNCRTVYMALNHCSV